jgi:hypothetical protein
MFGKDKPIGQDVLDMDPKLYRGLWTLSLVLAEIAKEEGEREMDITCPVHPEVRKSTS